MKRYAIIGFGGLGKKHFLNLLEIEKKRNDIQLVAICNSSIESIFENITINIGTTELSGVDFSKYNLYTDYKEMIEKENLDFVINTLPSHLHHPIGAYCLERGISVFVEKPMALSEDECADMISLAEKNNCRLMVGQVLRFFPIYNDVKNLIETEKYGKPVKAEFVRRSPLPMWSFENWLLDEKKCGGSVVDFHVHDLDMMLWLFGNPKNVHVLSTSSMVDYESMYALYEYDGFIASIITDWGIPTTYTFNSSFRITLEKAFIETIGDESYLYTNEKKEKIELPSTDPFVEEMEEFIEGFISGKPFKKASIESVYETMKLCFKQKKMLKR